jgi:hypothetical protein
LWGRVFKPFSLSNAAKYFIFTLLVHLLQASLPSGCLCLLFDLNTCHDERAKPLVVV